jgi:serine phosphatase RsbU (regulator of sigma subunit)
MSFTINIEEQARELRESINYAKKIQDAILPSDSFIKSLFPESFVLFKPKELLSGDFYWVSDAVTNEKEKFVMAAVVDCTGHGIPGALMSIIANNFLRICERESTVNRPSEALDFINVGLSKTLRQEYSESVIKDGMDMVFIALEYSTMTLHFAGAKNSIYIIRNNELIEYKGDRHPIGAYVGEEFIKFTNHSIKFEQGDNLYMFSDGYVDQFGGKYGKKFLSSRFKQLLMAVSSLPMEKQKQELILAFEKWKGNNEQLDDVCVFGLKL